MPNEENLLKLYNALGSEYDLGTYNDFKIKMEDANNRSKLWSAANVDYDLGDFSAFEQKIGYSGALGKATPGSGAGASGGLRLPSNLSKQQVKSYLGKYGASFTDAQYEQIASQARGKSLDEAIKIAESVTTIPTPLSPPKNQPAPESSETVIPEFNLNRFVTEEVQRTKTPQELEALKQSQFAPQREAMAQARDLAATSRPIAQDIAENERAMMALADDVISGKVTEIDLGPIGTVDVGSLEKETGFFTQLKDNPKALYNQLSSYIISRSKTAKDISEETVLPYLDSYANIKELKKQNEDRIKNLNDEIEFLSQIPNADLTVYNNLKAELKKEKAIRDMVNPSISALYDELSVIDAAPIAAKNFGINVWDPFLSLANGLAEQSNILLASNPAAAYLQPVLKEKVKQAKAENDIRRENLQFKEMSDQNILDGLNLMNGTRGAGQALGSMGAVFGGGLAAGPAGAAYMGFTLTYGDSLDEARKAGFSESEAQMYATIYGTASAALEAFGFKGVSNAFMNTAVKKQVLSSIRSMMASGATKEQILKEVIDKGLQTSMSFLKGAAPEALTEMAQTSAEFGTKKAFNLLATDAELGEKGFELPTLEEGFKQIAEAGIIGGVFGGFVPGVKALSRSKKNEYKNLAKSVVRGDVSQESLQNNVRALVNTGSITQQQGTDLMQNIEIAVAAKNSLPTYITDGAARERGVELILERNKIAEEMNKSDEDLQDGYKQRLSQIKAELKTISDNKWKAPVDPVIATTVAGLETMTQSLSTHPEPDTAARIFTESLNTDRGMLAVLADAMAAGKEIAAPVIERASVALSALADAFESNPKQTEYTKAAASQAREMADRLSQYTTKVASVTNGKIPSLNVKEILGRIKAGIDAGTIDFMEGTPDEIAMTFSDIMDGKDVSEEDAKAVADFLYGKYKQIMDFRTDLQNKIEEESSPEKKERLKKSVQAVNEVLSRLNGDIESTVKYQQEKALQDEAAGTRKQTPLGQPSQEQAPSPAPAPVQEFDPRNIAQVADDYQQKTGDVLTGVMATALKTVAKLLAKIAPNVKFYVHSTTQEFLDAVKQEGVNEDLSKNAGAVVQSDDGTVESLHINLELALSESTAKAAKYVYHEAAHVLLGVYFRSDKYRGADMDLIFDMAKAIRSALPSKYKGPLAEFVGRYKDKLVYEQEEEFIAELIDMLANDEASLDKPTIAKIIAVINKFITAACEKFGIDPEKYLLSNNRADLIDFVNSTSRAVKSGLSSDLSEKATTRLQRKYAVQEQATGEVPVQSRTKSGRTLAKGEPKTGPQETTQEGGQEEEVTPSRTAEVLFTTATLRDISARTKQIAKLTNLFDESVKSVPYFTADVFSSGNSKIVRSINNFASGILDGYAELIAAVSESIGVKYKSGNYYIGSWEGSFEPSMNISFSITDDTNTQGLSDLFNKLSEDTSQDAYIIETVAKQDQEFRKTGKIVLFTELQDGTSIYPQVKVEFKDNLSVSERSGLAKLLSDGNIPAFSIGDNFVKISSFAEDVDDYKDEKSNFENIIKNSAFSDLYSKTTEQIKQSNYIAGEKDGNRRNYSRGDVFEAFKPNAKQSRPKKTKSGRTGGILGTGGKEGGSLAPLEGAPFIQGATGPDPNLVAVAEQYAKENGINLKRQAEYVDVDEDRAIRIAKAYEEMVSDPSNPKVKKAYKELVEQTRKQYDALVKAGYEFTFFDSESDPYDGNPSSAMRDLRANKKMAVYGTYDGYGTDGITATEIENNPMLEDTGLKWKDQSGELKPVTANDLFRAVHDAFGHGLEGASFRARGEENAWQAHVRLFTGDAIAAITTETRGQNSWLNYGPYGESNRTAKVNDTVFAENKIGLLPEWTWTEGRAGDMEQEAPATGKKTKAGRTKAARIGSMEDQMWQSDPKSLYGKYQQAINQYQERDDNESAEAFDKAAKQWRAFRDSIEAAYSAGNISKAEIDEMSKSLGANIRIMDMEPLGNKEVYHVTISKKSVLNNGLLTKNEVYQSGLSEGIGGGSGISVTWDKTYAERIYRVFDEMKKALNGDVGISEEFSALDAETQQKIVDHLKTSLGGTEKDILNAILTDSNTYPRTKWDNGEQITTQVSPESFIKDYYNALTFFSTSEDREWLALHNQIGALKDADIAILKGKTAPNAKGTTHPAEREYRFYSGEAIADLEEVPPPTAKRTKAGRTSSALADVESTAKALEVLVKDKVKTPNDIPNTMGTHLQNITDGAWLIRDGDKSKEWVDLVNNAIKEVENVFSVIPYSGKVQKAFSSIKNKVKNDNYDISKEVSELSSATKKEFYKGGEGWGVSEISEAYHKAKQDGSNPELVQAVEDLLEPQPGKKTKSGRTKAGSFKNGYDPNEAADRGNQEDRDLQKRIYDAALEVWDSTKDLMDLSADIYEAVSDKLGIGLNPIHIGELVKDLRTGNRPEYSKTPDGKYKRSKTKLREGAVMTSALEALERLATDRRVNKGIISSLTKALKGGPQYTVEGQMDIESIADALFDIFGGSTNLTALQELYNIAEVTKGGLRSFMFARIANDAWNKARESKDQQEKLEYRNIGNRAVMQLGQEATEAGRFNAMIYRIQKLNPEFLAAYQKTQLREETESQMRSSGKKKSNVVSATTALNTAQTQAAEQATSSPSVQAAINTATGTPPSTSTPPPAPKSKPGAPKPPAPAPAPSATKVIDDRIKELKGKLKDLFSGKKTKSARVLPASINPEILDVITELARNYIKKGMTDRTALISKINGDVTAAGGSITMDYFTEMWNEVQGEAVQQRNGAAAASLANRIVGKVKGAIRTSTKTFDPIAELITDLVNKATEDVETPKRAKESPLEKIKRLLVEFDTAKKIWEASKAKVEAKIDGLDPAKFTLSEKDEMKKMLDDFFDNDLSYFEIKKTSTPSPDATVRNAIKQEMKDKKLKIEEILLTANSKKAATRDQFIQNIVDGIVYSTGISYNQAIKIAEDFTRKYDEIVTKKQESILKRYSSQRRVNNIKKKSQGQRAFEMIKYGALDPSIEIHDKDGNIIDSAMLLAEIFGVPYIDDVTRDALDVYAEAIADTPEGVIRQQVINDMMMFMKMHQYRQLGSLGDRIMSQFYANLLTSTDTLIKAFNSNVLMNPFEYLSIATRAAVKGDFALIPLLTRGFYQQKGVGSVKELKATRAMSDVDGYVINQGESYYLFNDKTIMSLANPKAVALSGHYEGLLRYSASMNQARGVLENIVMHENFTNNVTGAVYEKHAKSRAGRVWGKYVTLAQKGLGALDALVTAGATGARYSDLLFDAIRHYAKINGQKIKGSEIVKIVNLLQGYSPMVQLDAYNQAIAEMEIVEGGQVDLSDRKKKTLLLLRVEEIVREKMKDRYQQAVNENPWLSGLEQQEIADMLDEAKEISTKIGLMGKPPGTSGVLSHLLGLPGKTVRFSNMQYGAFTNAPVNAANFLLQGNTPLAALILSVRLLKSERGLGLGSDEFFKREGIRTKMYGKTSTEVPLFKNSGIKWNLEKQDMLTKFVMIQAPVIAMTYMAANAVMVSLASMFDDDEDRDKLLKDGVEFLRTVPQKDRELMFFGDPLSPDAKKKAGVWKTLPFYTTGAMYGYSDGGYGKMQSLRARFGIEPYTVYSYGKKIFSYKDNPLLGAFFMEMAAATDALLFNETANLEDTQLGMIMASTWSQMNLIRDQSNLRSISEIVELLAGQRAYEGLDGYNARAQMYLSRTAANILSNGVMPAEMKNLNQDIMAMIGQYMDDPKQFHEFVVYRWPIIGNAVIEGDKTGPFGYPLKMQPKRVFPIGTEQFKLPLMLDGSLDVPTVDQLLSTEDAAYTALFERNKNDKFLKPGISGYYKLNKYGDYERETFTLEEQKKIREEYKLIMREFAEENIGLTQSPKEFDIRLKIFLGLYGVETGKNRVQTMGYKRYIVNKVMGSKAGDILLDEADGLINMNKDQMLLDKIKETEEGFEPLPR